MNRDDRLALRARLRAARRSIKAGTPVPEPDLAALADAIDLLASEGIEAHDLPLDRVATLGLRSCAASIRFLAASGSPRMDTQRIVHCLVWSEGFCDSDQEAMREAREMFSPEP